MRILIVEDEPEAREGLAQLLSAANLDWEVMPPCINGALGLVAASTGHPDLIITDIRMPHQNGLDMIKDFRKKGHSVPVIVLSGYPDFEYARQCLALGVREYLVKPATPEKVLDAVRAVEDEVFSTSELTRALKGVQPTDQVERNGLLLVYRYARTLSHGERTILKQETREWIGTPHRLWASELDLRCYFFAEKASMPAKGKNNGILKLLERRMGVPIVGCCRSSLFSDIAKNAKFLASDVRRFLMEPQLGFIASELPPFPLPRRTYDLTSEAAFSRAWQTGLSREISHVFELFFLDCFQMGFDPEFAVEQAGRFFFAIQNLMREFSPPAFRALLELNPNKRLGDALRWEDVKDLFLSGAALLELSETSSLDAGNPKIQSALALVRDRLDRPPSLSELAEELRLSPEYLSRLFKQHVGVGFAKYVMSQRVVWAKTLLSDRSLTVNSVAEKLGFQSIKYFYEVFRKETGLTPNEYRDRLI